MKARDIDRHPHGVSGETQRLMAATLGYNQQADKFFNDYASGVQRIYRENEQLKAEEELRIKNLGR